MPDLGSRQRPAHSIFLTPPGSIARFLDAYTSTFLLNSGPLTPKSVKAFLSEISPILSFSDLVDLSGPLLSITTLLRDSLLSQSSDFAAAVLSDVIGPALDTSSTLSSAGAIFSLSSREAIVSLLVRACSSSSIDPISRLVQEPASPGMLAGIVLPLALELDSEEDRVWLQLLQYAIEAVRAPLASDASSSRSRPASPSSSPSRASRPARSRSLSPSPRPSFSTHEKRAEKKNRQRSQDVLP